MIFKISISLRDIYIFIQYILYGVKYLRKNKSLVKVSIFLSNKLLQLGLAKPHPENWSIRTSFF